MRPRIDINELRNDAFRLRRRAEEAESFRRRCEFLDLADYYDQMADRMDPTNLSRLSLVVEHLDDLARQAEEEAAEYARQTKDAIAAIEAQPEEGGEG